MLRTWLARALCLWLIVAAFSAHSATLLPNGEQQFLDTNGLPLTGGSVYFYIPNTTTPKATWTDAGQTTLNTNPVVLNAAGRATIYGSGSYRQIVKDAGGAIIWDRVTADTSSSNTSWGGTCGGTANAQTVSAASFTSQDGQVISCIAGVTNTGPLSLNPNGSGPISVLKDTAAGPVALVGGEVTAGNIVNVVYDSNLGSFHLVDGVEVQPFVSVASASTVNLGAAGSPNVSITGTTTITSFGTGALLATPLYRVVFAGVLQLTHNGTSLILPGGANITTAAGDNLVAQYLGSGNWRVLSYTKVSGLPVKGTSTPVASNLVITNGGTPASTVAVSASSVTMTDSSSIGFTATGVGLAINAATTGANGLDTGSLANNTWYYIYAISNGATTAGLMSTSATAPTMPTGYTYKMRVGAIRTDGSAGFYRFYQRGSRFSYVVTAATNTAALPSIASGSAGNITSPTWAATTISQWASPTAAVVFGTISEGSSATAMLAPNNSYGA